MDTKYNTTELILNYDNIKEFVKNIKHLPEIKTLCFMDSPPIDHDEQIFEFFRLNPQLREMHIINIHCDWTRAIGKYLPNLESLTIDHEGYSGNSYDTKPLSNLKQLKKLALLEFREYDMPAVLKYVCEYGTHLVELDLSTKCDRDFDTNTRGAAFKRTLSEIQSGLIKLAKELSHLEIFKLFNYTLDVHAVIGFIEVSISLNEFHINGERMRVGPKWIKDMANARDASPAAVKKPLKLVINDVKLNARNLKLLQSEDIRRYLTIELSDRKFNFSYFRL